MTPFIYLPPTSRAMRRRRLLVTLLFMALAAGYSVVTPIFEISDELSHYPVIDYIADRGELPVQNINREHAWDWEAAQPPLYYVITALMVAPFDRDDLDAHLIENPHAKIGIGLATDNQNAVLHDRDAQKFPWRATPLHVHLLRLFSVLLGTGAMWMTFTVARLTVPDRPAVALVAQCLTAFNPMFLAIVGSVNNDNLVIFLVSVTLAVILTFWHRGFAWRRVWALALLGTLAAAAKLSGTIVFIPAGLVILLVVRRDRLPLSYVAVAAGIFFVVWGGLFGWWYIRNLDLYNDALGSDHMARTVGLREEPIGVIDLFREEWFSFYAAYWGWFGTVNILAPITLFYIAGALQVGGVVGLVKLGVVTLKHPSRRKPDRFIRSETGEFTTAAPPDSNGISLILLLIVLMVAFISLIAWTLQTPASQGRLLFPFIAAISTLTALGLVNLLGGKWALLLTSVLLAYAVYCMGMVIPRAFRLPQQVVALPDDAHQVDVRYGDIELLGYRIDPTALKPDGLLRVVLYWRAFAQTDTPLSFYIQVFAPEKDDFQQTVEVGKVDSYPGRGLLRTDTWQTGVIYEDVYYLELTPETAAGYPFEPRLKVGWRDQETDSEIPAVNAAGDAINAVILRGGRVFSDSVSSAEDSLAEFGGAIRLYATRVEQADGVLQLHVTWGALWDIDEDFTVFVQLVDSRNQPLAFGDSVPRDGWWRTSLWVPGNRFDDRYTIPLEGIAPGDYRILLGFYRPTDFTRLPVSDGAFTDAFALDVSIQP